MRQDDVHPAAGVLGTQAAPGTSGGHRGFYAAGLYNDERFYGPRRRGAAFSVVKSST